MSGHRGAQPRRLSTNDDLQGRRGGRKARDIELRSVEELQTLINRLVRERQELRAADASAERLESNRRELVHAQWALSKALIAQHLKEAA